MHDVTDWQHSDDYRIDAQHHAERTTLWVIALTWMDPLMGIVSSIVIGRWAIRLLRDSGGMLMDAEMRIADLHISWVGERSRPCIPSTVTEAGRLLPRVAGAGAAPGSYHRRDQLLYAGSLPCNRQ